MKLFTLVMSLSLASVSVAAAVSAPDGLLEKRDTNLPLSDCAGFCRGQVVRSCVLTDSGATRYTCG
ncbi:hypothetical protein HYFRA_00005200 [Hymenoscyphus fraxineus]|uniref:Uncharacterized protein n=1 Tax=Hymenoscyphus fraxineus TaxID=746836 RepID=A0A9N9LAP4_9HELO|nr:hypothetical protein HYFRA_00005200 [Hymenoscyphus fraxineus]